MNEQETYMVSFPVKMDPHLLDGGLVTTEEEIARRVANLVEHEIYRNQAQGLITFYRHQVTVTKVTGEGAPIFQEPVATGEQAPVLPKRRWLSRLSSKG